MMELTEHGLKEGLRSTAQIRRILQDRRRTAEATLAQAEVDVTELRKLESYAATMVQDLAARLAALTGAPTPSPDAL